MKEPNYLASLLIKRKNIAIIWVGISIVIVTLAGAFFSYEKDILLRHERGALKEVGMLKIEQVEEWNKARMADAIMFSQSPFFKKALIEWVQNTSNSKLHGKILARLNLININGIYEDIIVVSPQGKILLSISDSINMLDNETSKLIYHVVSDKNVHFTDLYKCLTHKTIHLDYLAPVVDSNKVTCVLIFRQNIQDKLFPLIEEWPVFSRTAETVLVERNGDSVLFLNNLRQKSYTALNYKLPLSKIDEVSVKAVSGYTGFYEGENYMGQKVVAYMAPIKGTPWFLVAKINRNELYEPLYFRGKITLTLTILLLVILLFGLVWYHNYLKKYLYYELLRKEKSLVNYYKGFYTILYSIGDGVITTDTEGNVSIMNAVAEKLTGWKAEEAQSKPIDEVFNIINEQTRKKVENPIQKVIDKGLVVGLANHTILISRDGHEIPIADSAAPIFDELSLMQGVVLVFRDKSEEHLAERKIRESELRLKRAEIASSSGNWEIHLKTGEVNASVGAYSIYGVNINEKLSIADIQKIPLPQYRTLLNTALKNLIGSGTPYNVEFKIKSLDSGEIKDIHSIAEYDKESNIVFGVIQDVTQRKKVEKQQLQLLNIVDNTLNEIYVFNVDTLRFEYVNKGALNNIGYTYQEMMELTPLDIKPNFTEESFRSFIEPLIAGNEQNLIFETIHKRKNGTTYDVEIHLQFHKVEDTGVFFAVINDITNRKTVEQSLIQSQERWKNLFDNSPSSIAIYKAVDNGADFIFTDFNLLAQKTEDLKRDEVVGKRISEMFPSAEELGFLDAFRKVWKTGVTEHMEATHYKDGRIEGWRENIIYKLNTDEVVAIYSDVSARVKAEIALRTSEERYRVLFNNMTQAFALHEIILDEKGKPVDYRYLDVNSTFEELSGFKHDDIVGKTVLEVMPLTEGYWIEIYGKVALTGEPKRFENYSRSLGKYFDVWTFSPKTGQFAVVFSDVTKRKKTEEQVQKLSKGIDQSPAIVVITDINGNVEYANPRFVEVTGYSLQEVLGKNPRILKSGKQNKEYYEVLWNTILGGNDWKGELQNKKKNGELYWESALISPIKNDNGEIKFFIAIKEDITERKINELAIQERDLKLKEQNEEYLALNEELSESNERIRTINRELLIAKEKAEESDRLKSAFLANMSHEIRTPMNGILGFSELLKKPNISEDQQKEFLNIIDQSGQRLLELINNLIDISKIESGQMDVVLADVDIKAELTHLYSFFKFEANKKGLNFLLQGGEPFPEYTILTDRQKLVSIISNLLKNAIKFTEKGSIDFGFSVGTNYVEFYVADTGLGIASEFKDKVFDRFVQVDSSNTRRFEGAGLGLSITKSYVEMLGGSITLETEEGTGTCFYFNLPQKNKEPFLKPTIELKYKEVMTPKNKLNILIAEDDKFSKVYLTELIGPMASKIFQVQTGSEAVELCYEEANIDLILMDIKMPDMDGIEATKLIRKFNQKVVIIAQTAFALAGDREKAILAGCNDYITKPIKAEELKKVINKWCRS